MGKKNFIFLSHESEGGFEDGNQKFPSSKPPLINIMLEFYTKKRTIC